MNKQIFKTTNDKISLFFFLYNKDMIGWGSFLKLTKNVIN